jgi:hypothetical protein
MMRKRVFMVMVAGLGLAAAAAFGQNVPAGGVCCNGGVAQAPAGQQCVLLHRVGPGENLHILAAYYYGDARAWQRIYNLNRKSIANPNKIKVDQILRIEVPPCWTPRFDLQEFLRLEEKRVELMQRAPTERPREFRSKETVEPKVTLSVEEEGGETTGQPRRPAPGPGAPPPPAAPPAAPAGQGAPPTVETEE